MLLGTPDEVEGSAKKLTHMKVFVDRLFPGRWDELRAVSTKELKATKVMGMEIDEASAKIRPDRRPTTSRTTSYRSGPGYC